VNNIIQVNIEQDKIRRGLIKTTTNEYFSITNCLPHIKDSNISTDYWEKFSEKQDKLKKGLLKLESGIYVSPSNISELIHTKPKVQDQDTAFNYSPHRWRRLPLVNGIDPDDCFIATAVYGNPYAPQVNVLREYRDNVLSNHPLGRMFIKFYYSGAGERTANFIKKSAPSTIPIIRKGLDHIVEKYNSRNN